MITKGAETVKITTFCYKQANCKNITFEIFKTREPCEWIEVNHDNFSGIYKNTPDRDSLSSEINESFIVELYSR